MNYNKKISENEIVFIIDSDVIDDNICASIVSEILPNKKAGLDMKHVKRIEGYNFVEYLLKNKYKLYNLQNDVLTYLSIIIKDGFLKSFMSKEDFCKNKRELIKRNFLVV